MKRLIIPLGAAMLLAAPVWADFSPVPLNPSSFNYDMVIENTGPAALPPGGATTASMDGGTANNGDTWNEQGYFLQDANVGLPPAGSTINASWNANYTYTFAPSYTAFNAILIDAGPYTNANWKLTTPTAYQALSFLTSGGNGGDQFRYTVQRQDGTSDVGTAASPDWFFVNINRAWTANGRVNAQSFTLDNYNSDNPRLYSVDVTLTASTSPVTNIFIEYVSGAGGSHSCIMAISGTPTGGTTGVMTPVLGTGYNADIVVEATFPKRWDYNPPASVMATATMDGGINLTGDTWFEQGYYTPNATFGLPPSGSTFNSQSAADHRYTMASYAGNNAVMLDSTVTSATITLATPTAYSALSLLGSSGGGACNVQLVVNHADSTTETFTIAVPDWFGATPAWTANGRINVGNGLFENINSGNPRLCSVDFALANTVSPITTLDLTYTSGGRGAIFALSATAGAVAPLFAVQPVSVTVSAGAAASFSATVSGTEPITYQWEKGTNGVYVNVSGATTTTLSIPSAGDADEADYRLVAANVAGSATSAVATLTVLSTLPAITLPTDPIVPYQPLGGSSPGGEAVSHAIDGVTQKYLNFGDGAAPCKPVGFDVTPTAGRTFLKVVRFYTANDATERDPANYVIEGSNDGTTWTLIASNIMTLPDGRNAGGTTPIDPTTQFMRQVRLVNNTSYGAYRVYFTLFKGNTSMMQIGEVEMLGTVDSTGYPIITTSPVDTKAYVNSSVSFIAAATGTPAPTFRWRKGSALLSDGGRISGSSTPTLTINPADFSDAADYSVIVANSLASLTSSPAHLTIVSTLTDITQPGDPTTTFGDESAGFWGANALPENAIDNTFAKYQNGGHGFSAAAGFPPFVGPVGITVTPAFGSSLVIGVRIYTADGSVERDPTDLELFGSNDSGATWVPIISTALALPQARVNTGNPVEPIANPMQEVLFPNSQGFTSYKVQFTHTRNDGAANSLQIGELELLGGPAVPLAFTRLPSGQIQLTWTQGTLLEATDLLGPWTTNSAPSPLIITPTGPQKFYKLVVQ